MATVGTFFIVILLTIANAFLNGWFLMMGYELGIAPLINHISVAPEIPYVYFVLLILGWDLIKSKRTNTNDDVGVTDVKFWTKYLGIIVTDFLILGVLWVFNLCIVG